MAKKKKRKKVTVKLVQEMYAGNPTEPYVLMKKVLSDRRPDLVKAGVVIVLAWRSGWRDDADGHVQIGKCDKRKDLDREMVNCDFVISLNEEIWPHLSDNDKYRWMWHELCHAEIKYDSDGSVLKDDKGRVVCRIRKHDIQEFAEIVEELGLDTELATRAKAGRNDAQRPLFNQSGDSDKPSQKESKRKKQSTRKKRTVKSMQEEVASTENVNQ